MIERRKRVLRIASISKCLVDSISKIQRPSTYAMVTIVTKNLSLSSKWNGSLPEIPKRHQHKVARLNLRLLWFPVLQEMNQRQNYLSQVEDHHLEVENYQLLSNFIPRMRYQTAFTRREQFLIQILLLDQRKQFALQVALPKMKSQQLK